MAKYFDDKGYFNGEAVFTDNQPFVFILGGRGTGKTYSITNWLCDHCTPDSKFLLMRRTAREMDFINAGNIYEEHHPDVTLNTRSKIPEVKRGEDIIGYHVALSSIHNLRGFAMQDVSYILFDEFIAERGTVIRKYAGEQMLNAYETINRNRELNGKKPVKAVFLSNFNTAESDIMEAFGFTDEIYTYSKSKPIGVYRDDYKELIMINDSPISSKKSQTVLYKATTDKEFASMSLDNDGSIQIMPIKHYSREAYEFIGVLGNIKINRLYSGYYYLTENEDVQPIEKKDILKYHVVYHSYLLGNVYANSTFIAQSFVDIYE